MTCNTNEKILSFDNKTIYGIEYIPAEISAKVPALIMSHGFNGSHADMDAIAEYLAGNGIYVYAYDFCGGSNVSKSSGSTREMSVSAEISELEHVLDEISSLVFVDRVYLYGESQGGFVSALTAGSYPDRIAGLFMLYPAFCIPDDWLGRTEDELKGDIDFAGMFITKAYYDGVPRYDVFEHAAKFKGKVKIYHGDCDRVVNLRYSKKLIEKYDNASLRVIEGADHGFSPEKRDEIAREICSVIKC